MDTKDLAAFGAATLAAITFGEKNSDTSVNEILQAMTTHLGLTRDQFDAADEVREIAIAHGIDTNAYGDDAPDVRLSGTVNEGQSAAVKNAHRRLYDVSVMEDNGRADVSDLLDATRDYVEALERYARLDVK